MAMSFPQVRTAALHAATFAGGIVAAISFMASHSVDLYAAYDQLNTVIKDIQALLAIVAPIASGAYAVYRATTANKILDLKQDGAVKGVITTPDAAGIALANKVPDITVVPAGTMQAAAVATS